MNFDNLKKNQPSVVQLLENSFKSNRLSHVYLFSGVKEALKLDAAFYLASLILCENGTACGKCEECKKISRFANPSLYLLTPSGDTIKKEQIEDLEHEFGFAYDKPHVFIIQNIEKANASSANTLLKFLEELHDNCYGILLTDRIESVLPTIISRSQLVKFKPILTSIIKSDLIGRGLTEEKASVVANLSTDINKAFELARDPNVDFVIEAAKKISYELETGNGYLEYNKLRKSFEKLDKLYVRFFVDILMMLQKDKINALILRNGDLVFEEEISNSTILRSKDDEVKILEIILKYRDRLESYANVDMVLTGMFVSLDF